MLAVLLAGAIVTWGAKAGASSVGSAQLTKRACLLDLRALMSAANSGSVRSMLRPRRARDEPR